MPFDGNTGDWDGVRFVGATHPLKAEYQEHVFAVGKTVAEILEVVQPDPVLRQDAVVYLGDYPLPKELWHRIRPKYGTQLTARMVPVRGGGPGKNPLRTILTLALLAGSFYLAPMLGGFIASSTGIGAMTANAIASGIIGIAGFLLINAIAPIRPPTSSSSANDSPNKFIESSRNQSAPFQPVPQVLGKMRMFGFHGTRPYTELIGDQNRIRMILVWSYGEVTVSSLRIGDTAITNFDNVDIQTRPGSTGAPDPAISKFPSIVDQVEINVPIKYDTDLDGTPDGWTVRTTSDNADEISIDLAFPRGLTKFDSKGNRSATAVEVDVQYKQSSSGTWLALTPADTDVTFDKATIFGTVEVTGASGINTAGSNYAVNDTLTVVGGTFTRAATFKVTTVNGSGGVTGVSMTDAGVYTVLPSNPVATTSRKVNLADTVVGSGCKLNLTSLSSGSTITFTQDRTVEVRHGLRWPVSPRGKYDVRVRRRTVDAVDDRTFDEVHWRTLRRFTHEDPIKFPYPLATSRIIIKGTDQIEGSVDQINALVQTVCLDWNGASWVKQATNNPASLFRYVLQGNANARKMVDGRIDLTMLQTWHTFCATNGFTFNQVRDFRASVWDTLADIAAAGRASPTQRDGKWSVVIDQVQSTPVTHVTPRNSWNFEAEKTFLELPDAFRVQFQNEREDYHTDERIVYRDGYNADGSDGKTIASVFESLSFPGVTNPSHVYKLARYHAKVAEHRPERWTFNQDFESLVLTRGSRFLITHDVLLVGLASGRVKSLIQAGTITGVVVDEVCNMSAGPSYGITFRNPTNGAQAHQVVTSAGAQTTLTFTTPLALGTIAVGDLFGFGVLNSQTEDALVLAIERQDDFVARIVSVPYRSTVYNVDSESEPTYVTNITRLPEIPAPTVVNTRSDESVMLLDAAGNFQIRLAVSVKPLDQFATKSLHVQIRPSNTKEPFYNAVIERQTENEVVIGDVRQGKYYDLRLRWVVENRLPGAYALISNHRVVGKSTPPAALPDMTLQVFNGAAYFKWSRPTELDVLVGGTVKFQHSPLFTGATWAASHSIGQAVNADQLHAVLPLLPGTYLARTFDRDGNPGGIVTMNTKQASVLEFAAATSIDEAPSFSGTKTNVVANGGSLFLDSTSFVDDYASWDDIENFDAEGGITATGEYLFSSGFDFLAVTRVRLTSRISQVSSNVQDFFDNRDGLIDSWEDFDGDGQAEADAGIWVRHTDDNPSGSPTWSDWRRLDSAEYEHRGFQFKAVLLTRNPSYNSIVTELGVDAQELV